MVENYGVMLTNFGDFYTGDKVKILLCGSTYYLVSRGDGVGITIPKSYIKIVKHKAKVINLFGGSGIGKSTLAAKLFSTLKEKGLECELVTEFAKDLVWEERKQALSCQPYVFGEQLRRQCIVGDKVDYIITHSPSASVVALLGWGLYEQDILTRYLEEIRCKTEYKRHYFGHMHDNRLINDKDILLYEQIVRIV